MLFTIGDYIAAILTGVVTALAVRDIISSGMDMVIAMLLGMGIGIIVHLIIGLVLSPLLGMFQTMVPASLVGMYGGMLFGMRDAMAAGSATTGAAALVGGVFGLIVVSALKIYDHVLRGKVLD
jgi:hypothetical protein